MINCSDVLIGNYSPDYLTIQTAYKNEKQRIMILIRAKILGQTFLALLSWIIELILIILADVSAG